MGELLRNKVVLVTGAGSGIGRATSLVCAREGARLVVTDRDRTGGTETVAAIIAAGGQAACIQTDVTHADQIEAAVAFAISTYGRLDGAFNNAGIVETFTSFLDGSDETFSRIMKINVEGVWRCMRAEIRQMLAQGGGGAIVNTASVAGLKAAPMMPIYGASKHAVIGMSKAAAIEFANRGPRINIVCPGAIDTPMLKDVTSDERALAAFTAGVPAGRFGTPAEIGEAVAWLLSDAASYVTGSVLSIDGGMTS